VQVDRRVRQRDVGAAEQELAAAQRAVDGDGGQRVRRIAARRAIVDGQARTDVLRGDRRVGRVERGAGERERALDPQRRALGRMHAQAAVERAALELRVGPGLREQRLRPGERHAREVDGGEVGRRRAAGDGQRGAAVAQGGDGARVVERDRQPHRLRAAAAHRAFATPAAVRRARQRALPTQVTVAVAEVGRVERADVELQVALRFSGTPGQPHAHVAQRGDAGRRLRDAQLRDPRRIRRARAGSRERGRREQQD
jgi:hypothetical protein